MRVPPASFGCKEIYLETAVNNEPALRLYRKLGYQILAHAAGLLRQSLAGRIPDGKSSVAAGRVLKSAILRPSARSTMAASPKTHFEDAPG